MRTFATYAAMCATALAVSVAAPRVVRADDTAEVSTTAFEEKRDGGKGLTVIHPQADVGIDLSRYVTLDAGYAADAVSGATATIYKVDAITSATTFSDLRQEGNLSLGFNGRRSHLTINGSVGTERDYVSRAIGASGTIDLPGRNTTVELAYGHSSDQVCDKDNEMDTPLEREALTGADPCKKAGLIFGKDTAGMTTWRGLSIDTSQVSLTQNLSPTSNLQIAAFGQILNGFQSNPYRRVLVGPATPQENLPSERARWSVSARYNHYITAAHSAIHLDARGYNDTWGVTGGDVELGYSQYFGNSLLLLFHARVYQQTAASFFKDAFYYQTQSTAGEYFTGERELSPVRDAIVGAKLTVISVGGDKKVWGMFNKLQLNIKADVLLLDSLPADNLAMNPSGINTQFLYGNGLIDAVILQLGLLGNY